ncbi:MAG: hypothetical protein A2Z83_04205 [Omnitrophica bacterium GWA2_52_8]|nr:MAG: hypothetical protein A2Z83_04205 [Omnitrophica bacterium GWA2_52_8]
MAKTFKAAKKSDIPADTGYYVDLQGRDIALYNVEGQIHAMDAICPHQGGPLHEGSMTDGKAMCPWHGWEFDIKTGACVFNDAIKQQVYKAVEKDGDIYIEI